MNFRPFFIYADAPKADDFRSAAECEAFLRVNAHKIAEDWERTGEVLYVTAAGEFIREARSSFHRCNLDYARKFFSFHTFEESTLLLARANASAEPPVAGCTPMNFNPFFIYADAPTVDVDEIRPMTFEEQMSLWPEARLIYGTWQDNDQEVFYLSRGGQFIRETGASMYVCDPAYARDSLTSVACDAVLELLVQANAFNGAEVSA